MKIVGSILLAILFLSCSAMQTYMPVEDVGILEVKFGYYKWNGMVIPNEGVSIKCGGEGLSPDFYISNIPANANAIIIEYYDTIIRRSGWTGANGSYWIPTENKNEVYVPSVVEGTFNLPEGIFVEKEHQGSRLYGDIGGVYRAPNKCRLNNTGVGARYFAQIKAVFKPYDENDQALLLATAYIELGEF